VSQSEKCHGYLISVSSFGHKARPINDLYKVKDRCLFNMYVMYITFIQNFVLHCNERQTDCTQTSKLW